MFREALLACILIFLLTNCGVQRNLPPSKDEVPPQKVLIIGAGSIVSKVVLENLSENMIWHLNKRGMKCDFIILEKVKPGSQFDKRTLESSKYDAYIIFHPFDSASLEMNHADRIQLLRNLNVFGVSPNSYQQKFLVQIYNKTDKTKPVWERLLQFDFDPTEKDKYNEIAYLVLNYLPFN